MGIFRSIAGSKQASSSDSEPFKPKMLEKLESRILLSGDGLLSISALALPEDASLDATQQIVQYSDLKTDEQIEEQDSSDSPEADLYQPLFTLSEDDGNISVAEDTSDRDASNNSELTQVAQTCLSSEVTSIPAIPNEDGRMPIDTNDADLSIEYATSIEIRGPPASNIEASITSEISSYVSSDEIAESSDVETIHSLCAPDLPGLQLSNPDISSWNGQIIYLDFDGEQDVIYNGPVIIGPFDVPAFAAPDNLAGQAPYIIANVMEVVNLIFADSGIVFTIDRPVPDQIYSTVYIGGDDSAFAEYGSFLGLTENVDLGNKDRGDKAFVFSDGLSFDQIVSVISHEIGHLLGYTHNEPDLSDNILSPVAVAPVVGDIPDQTITEGDVFDAINLDDYASDEDNLNTELNWTYSGNSELMVSITNRIATIILPYEDWNGSETIIFTATDPDGEFDGDAATFTVTDEGLMAYWPLDEEIGSTTTEDATGNSYIGSLSGEASFISGMYGNGVEFDGTDGIITFENIDYQLSDGLTVAFWTQFSGTERRYQSIIQKGLYYHPFTIGQYGSLLLVGIRTTDGRDHLTSNSSLQPDKWYHIAVTCQDGALSIYIDGQLDRETAVNGSLYERSESTTMGNNESGSSPFNGRLDEVYIYNRALSSIEIQKLMDGPVIDPPGFTVIESDGATQVSESGSTDSFQVVLNTEPASDVVINVTVGDTTEAAVELSSLTFTPGNWDIPQIVTVNGVDDGLVDGDQTTIITLSVDDAQSDDQFDAVVDQAISVTTVDTTVPVNNPPVIEQIDDKAVDEGDLLTFTAVATDSDIPVNAITFSLIDAPVGAVIDPVTGVFNWTPSEEQGPDSYLVTVRVTDDGTPNLYDEETFTITVNEVNSGPILATNIGATALKGGSETIDNTELQVTDTDNTSDELQFTLTIVPASGLLKLDGTTLDVGGTFTQADINSNLLTYEHDGGETISDSFEFTVHDGSGGSIGNTTFSITVTPVNDNPVLAANTGAVLPTGETRIIDNTQLQVTDTDNTSDELQFTLTIVPANGLLKLDGTTLDVGGTFTQEDIDSNLLTYEHDGGPSLLDSFQFTVSDGSGGSIGNTTFDITITNVNEPPTVSLINTITALPENTDTTNPIKVADIVVTDDGLGTNTLSLSGADASLFHIDGNELFLNAGVTLERQVDLEVYLNDPSCAAYWQFEEGALGYDSVGNNHLRIVGTETNTSDFIEGGASAEFSGTADRLVCSDSDLDTGFPMKSDGINKDITTIQWIKFTELGPTVNEFWAKYKYRNVVYRLSAFADGRVRISSGYEGDYGHQEGDWFGANVQTDRWYFIASTYQASDRSYRLQIYDYAAGDFLAEDLTGNFEHDINVGEPGDGFFVLSYASPTFSFKGLMDACIVFNRALSVQELEDIRLGMFGEGQGNAALDVTVEVDDPTIVGTPDDAASLSISIVAPNNPPVLEAIGDKTVDEGSLLTFTAVAADSDMPANVLSFSLIDAPFGAAIDPATGVFTWTPGEEQGPDSYSLTVRVTDDGLPNLYDQETITITVNEMNNAPVLEAIGDKTIDEGSLLTFTAVTADSDIPANVLTFSLIDAPSGAAIDPATGVFTWTPAVGQGPDIYLVTVRVTDDSTPSLFDEETITITVNLPE